MLAPRVSTGKDPPFDYRGLPNGLVGGVRVLDAGDNQIPGIPRRVARDSLGRISALWRRCHLAARNASAKLRIRLPKWTRAGFLNQKTKCSVPMPVCADSSLAAGGAGVARFSLPALPPAQGVRQETALARCAFQSVRA